MLSLALLTALVEEEEEAQEPLSVDKSVISFLRIQSLVSLERSAEILQMNNFTFLEFGRDQLSRQILLLISKHIYLERLQMLPFPL